MLKPCVLECVLIASLWVQRAVHLANVRVDLFLITVPFMTTARTVWATVHHQGSDTLSVSCAI